MRACNLLKIKLENLGLRIGEILALRWRDVDFSSGELRVEQACYRGLIGTPKTKGSRRTLPMPESLQDELQRLGQEICIGRASGFSNPQWHLRHEIQAAMSKEIHVGVQPLSRSEWVRLFEQNGLTVTWSSEAPMHLLVIEDFESPERRPAARLSLTRVQFVECALQLFKLLSSLPELAFRRKALVVGKVFGGFPDEGVEIRCRLGRRGGCGDCCGAR